MRATGASPRSDAQSAPATTSAAPPLLRPGALPAVMVPSALKTGRKRPRASRLVSARTDSSVSTTVTAPLRPAISSGTISAWNAPESMAWAAF